jgi:hypothetical protein
MYFHVVRFHRPILREDAEQCNQSNRSAHLMVNAVDARRLRVEPHFIVGPDPTHLHDCAALLATYAVMSKPFF